MAIALGGSWLGRGYCYLSTPGTAKLTVPTPRIGTSHCDPISLPQVNSHLWEESIFGLLWPSGYCLNQSGVRGTGQEGWAPLNSVCGCGQRPALCGEPGLQGPCQAHTHRVLSQSPGLVIHTEDRRGHVGFMRLELFIPGQHVPLPPDPKEVRPRPLCLPFLPPARAPICKAPTPSGKPNNSFLVDPPGNPGAPPNTGGRFSDGEGLIF